MSAERAYRAVRDAIKRGELMRPDSCQRCGRTPGPAADGRSGIQGHHHDYDAPLDVEWICAACHRLETPLPSKPGGRSYGENNGSHKLTRDKAAEIRTSQLSCRLLDIWQAVAIYTLGGLLQSVCASIQSKAQ